ncbi:MAG: hypothetical protein WCK16_04555 [Candidatus Moraniibacteriota bacterium]
MKDIIKELVKLINKHQRKTFQAGCSKIGMENMPSIRELFQLHKVFYDNFRETGVNHLPEESYFWSGQYIGREIKIKKIILAKISGVLPEKKCENSLGKIFGHSGQIIPSQNEWEEMPDWRIGDIRYVKEFAGEKPIPLGSLGKSNSSRGYQEGVPLHISDEICRNGECYPITMRPASWHSGVVFTNTDSIDCGMKAIDKRELLAIVGEYKRIVL